MAKNELVSLAFLLIKPMHTYAIGKLIDDIQLECWAKISRASLYTTLKKFEKSGEVAVKMVQEGNYPARKIFSITEKGQALFVKEMEAAIGDCSEINSVLFYLGINFFFQIDSELGLQWSEQRKNFLIECQTILQQNCDEYRQLDYQTPLISVEAVYGNVQTALDGVEKFQTLLRERSDYFDNFLQGYRDWVDSFESTQ